MTTTPTPGPRPRLDRMPGEAPPPRRSRPLAPTPAPATLRHRLDGLPEHVIVDEHRDATTGTALGYGYTCKHARCHLTGSGTRWHSLSGFPTRALAASAALAHLTEEGTS